MQLWEAICHDGVRLFSGTATLRSPTLLRITFHSLLWSCTLACHWCSMRSSGHFFIVYGRNSGNTGPQLEPLNSGSKISEHREQAFTVDTWTKESQIIWKWNTKPPRNFIQNVAKWNNLRPKWLRSSLLNNLSLDLQSLKHLVSSSLPHFRPSYSCVSKYVCLHEFMTTTCPWIPEAIIRGCYISWNWSYIWVLMTNLRSSSWRISSWPLNHVSSPWWLSFVTIN